MVWWLAWSTVDRQVGGSNLSEHFDFPLSGPRLGNQRPWYAMSVRLSNQSPSYVQPCLSDLAYTRSPATCRIE